MVPYPCIAVKELAACNTVCCEDADEVFNKKVLTLPSSHNQCHDPEPSKLPYYASSNGGQCVPSKNHFAN